MLLRMTSSSRMSPACSCTLLTVSMVQSFMRRTAAVVWGQTFLASLLDSSLKPAEPNRVPAANYSLYFQTNREFRRNLGQSLAQDAASVVQ